jgi:hypothetical protein
MHLFGLLRKWDPAVGFKKFLRLFAAELASRFEECKKKYLRNQVLVDAGRILWKIGLVQI